MSETVLVAKEGPVAVLTLNRPDKLNAINAELMKALGDAVLALDESAKEIRAVIVTGAGDKAFAAGADIAAMADLSSEDGYRFALLGHRTAAAMDQARFPILGAVNGFALGGGCEMALACDFLYASDKAKFGQPEVNLAVIPGFGGTQRLARRVGIARARELCFTGDILDANEALRIGLVNAVVPHAELMNKARETAMKIASKGPLAVAHCKRVMLRGEDVTMAAAMELEAQAFGALFGSEDQREGMKAFLEKRKATFKGA